jgi:phytoene dehydrogenase-like protein
VEEVLVTGDRASGVRLCSGEILHTRRAVVANASIWDTLKLLPDHPVTRSLRRQRQDIAPCDSFMHLHLGIDATGLPDDLACHHIVVNDWEVGVTAPQNVVLISIPSRLDRTLAPVGKDTIHVYTPGNEPYVLWQGLDRRSDAYHHLKAERSEVMWQALERVIPDIRDRVEVSLVGTPLTHERFLRRHHGSYGPAIAAGKAIFPGSTTPLAGLLCCGDSTFPGIGLPAVAASGWLTANTLVPVHDQMKLLAAIGLR